LHSALCHHSNESRALIVNLPISAQLEGTLYHSPNLHSGPCSSVGMRRGTVRYTEDTQMAMTNIHFALAMPHVKCNHKHHPTRPFSTSLSKQTLFYGWHWCVCVCVTSFLSHFNGHFPGELGSASSPLVSLLEENLLSTSFQRPFSRWTWVSQFPLVSLLEQPVPLGFSSGREPLGISGTGSTCWMPFLSSTRQIQATEEIQSTDLTSFPLPTPDSKGTGSSLMCDVWQPTILETTAVIN